VVKAKEERGRWALGAQHKMAIIDGAAYALEVIRPFARGQDGSAKLICSTDRHGYWRRGEVAAELHLSAEGIATLVAPEGATGGPFRPTCLMERVSRLLEDGAALLGNSIRAGVKGKGAAITYAVELLVSEGYVGTEPGERGARLHRSLKPYREEFG
jgi:hypothetical protein